MDRFWFYARHGSAEKHGPVSDQEIRTLISQGRLGTTDLLWTDGMVTWKPVSQVPEFGGTASRTATGEPRSIPSGLEPWMGFVGVMTVVWGIVSCLGCMIIPGVFLIIGGVALLGARSALGNVIRVDPGLSDFFLKLKTFMQMTGVVYIVTLVFILASAVVYFTMFSAFLSGLVTSP